MPGDPVPHPDGPRQEIPGIGPFQSRRFFRQLLAFGFLTLVLGHIAFFLPVRAFVPVTPEADPWWGMGLVLIDGTVIGMLVRTGITRLRHRLKTDREKE